MNITPSNTAELLSKIKTKISPNTQSSVVLCVPYVDLSVAIAECKGSAIKIGAQNCHWENSGAFTGEISPEMLADLGVEYCIIGHSERRQLFAETDKTVNLKLHSAINRGISPILCVGEALDERNSGKTFEIVESQIKNALENIDSAALSSIVIAYEPIWAIGTGKTATSAEANEVCSAIRELIAKLYSEADANTIHILYGGSMNSSNAKELLEQSDIDGGLIGGASLKPDDFGAIIEFAG